MKDLEKMLMSNKGKSEMSEQEMQAKMDVLKELLQMAQEAMGTKVKGGLDEMKKVSVMAPDSESLEAGLEKAKELTSHMPEGSPDEEATESPFEALAEAKSQEEEPEEENLFARKDKSLDEKSKKRNFFRSDDEE